MDFESVRKFYPVSSQVEWLCGKETNNSWMHVSVKARVSCVFHKDAIVGPNVSIEDGTEIGEGCHLYPMVSIGTYCKIGKNAIIKDGAQLKTGVVVCDGVTIGEYAIIGEGNVVDRTVEDFGEIESKKLNF